MMSPADAAVRLSNLLMIVPALFAISQSIAENQPLAVLFGLVDDPPRELLACKDALNQLNNNGKAIPAQHLLQLAHLQAAAAAAAQTFPVLPNVSLPVSSYYT